MVRFILTVPDRFKLAVLEQMLAWRAETTEGEVVEIQLSDKRMPREIRQASHAPAAASVAEVPALMATTPVPPATVPVPVDRSTKVYRVIDTAVYVGPVPHLIRMYLINHPNSTAKQIEDATGRGKKSVESAIWMLRDRGVVMESDRTL